MSKLSVWKKALRNAIDYPWESDIDSDHLIAHGVDVQ